MHSRLLVLLLPALSAACSPKSAEAPPPPIPHAVRAEVRTRRSIAQSIAHPPPSVWQCVIAGATPPESLFLSLWATEDSAVALQQVQARWELIDGKNWFIPTGPDSLEVWVRLPDGLPTDGNLTITPSWGGLAVEQLITVKPDKATCDIMNTPDPDQ